MAAALALASCASGPDSVRHPDLAAALGSAEPVLVLWPLASVYENELFSREALVDAEASQGLAAWVAEVLAAGFGQRGWTVRLAEPREYPGLAAGAELAAEEHRAAGAGQLLQALDAIGRGVRLHEKNEGRRTTDRGVAPDLVRSLAGGAGSLVAAVVVGCDGRFEFPPCGQIQFPPYRPSDGGGLGGPGFAAGTTVPRGLAVQIYWLEAASGRLLWYDDGRWFNSDSRRADDVRAGVEAALAELPIRGDTGEGR
ncbi:MAG: hypothetical protein AB1634_01720 [Thermodesulfobacteriota bacterium]